MWVARIHAGGTCTQLKADKGAEKSCRSRRRRRGQRRGKPRSRGRHPPPIGPTPTLNSKQPHDRVIVKHLRACDHWLDREKQFGELFSQSQLYRLMVADQRRDSYGRRMLVRFTVTNRVWFRSWQSRWTKLRNRIKPQVFRDVACIGPSFRYWLEQRLRILIDFGEPVPPLSADSSLRGMLEDLSLTSRYGPPAPGNPSRAAARKPSCRVCKDLGSEIGIGYPKGCRFCYKKTLKSGRRHTRR